MEVELTSEHISVRYENQGVSRQDYYSGLLRCCHCDGIGFYSPLDRKVLEQSSAGIKDPVEYDRLWSESGDGRLIGYRQLLHYRCGVYLGYGRTMSEEDLDELATQPLTPKRMAAIHSNHVIPREQVRRLLNTRGISRKDQDAWLKRGVTTHEVEESDSLSEEELIELGGRLTNDSTALDALARHGVYYDAEKDQYSRYKQSDIETIHKRLYITAEDRAAFLAHDRNFMQIPSPDSPHFVTNLNYKVLREISHGQYMLCQRCEEPVVEERPGLRYRVNQQHEWLYWHHECYTIIHQHHQLREKNQMMNAFDQSQRWRLDRITEVLQRLPLNEFIKWPGEPNAFLQYWEQRLNII